VDKGAYDESSDDGGSDGGGSSEGKGTVDGFVDVVLLGKYDGMDLGLEELLEDSVTNGIPVVGDIVGFGNDESRFFFIQSTFPI